MTVAIEAGMVDGVPLLRADSAVGRHAAGLTFRVGRFDETVATAGITHLVEHLSLQWQHHRTYEFNGHVEGRYTFFYVESADPHDVTDFMATVCRGLAADSRDALEQNKRVLRTEATSRGSGGPLGSALNERYGSSGPGLIAYEEFGLERLTWDEVESWRRRWFTASNAVLWVAGVPTEDLRLELPEGPRPSAGPLQPLSVELPGFVVTAEGGIGLSLVGARADALQVSLDVLQHRLTEGLRYERGISYNVSGRVDNLDADTRHVWFWADALPDQLAVVAHTALTICETVASQGATNDEIGGFVRTLRDALASPIGPQSALDRRARGTLEGESVRDMDLMIEELSRIAPDQVAAATRALLDAAIVTTPRRLPPVEGRMPQLPLWSRDSVSGVKSVSPDSGRELTTGDEGITLAVDEDRRVTVRFETCTALIRWNDGKSTMVGQDGFILQLDPTEWPNGYTVIADIAKRVPPNLHVAVDRPGPDRPQRAPETKKPPARGGSAAAARTSRIPRSMLGWRHRILFAVFQLCAIFGLAASWSGRGGAVQKVGLAVAGFGVVGWAAQWMLLRRKIRRLRAPSEG